MSISLNFKSLISPFLKQSETKPTEAQVQSLKDLLVNRDTAVSLARNFGFHNGGTTEMQSVVNQLNELLKSDFMKNSNITNAQVNSNEESYRSSINQAVAEFIKNLVDYMKSPEAILRKIIGDYSEQSEPIYQIVA